MIRVSVRIDVDTDDASMATQLVENVLAFGIENGGYVDGEEMQCAVTWRAFDTRVHE